jgi:hypothetical protein
MPSVVSWEKSFLYLNNQARALSGQNYAHHKGTKNTKLFLEKMFLASLRSL